MSKSADGCLKNASSIQIRLKATFEQLLSKNVSKSADGCLKNVSELVDYCLACFSAGFAGDTCEVNLNDCNPTPCLSGAKCHDWIDDFYCFCPPWTYGKVCGKCNLHVKKFYFFHF